MATRSFTTMHVTDQKEFSANDDFIFCHRDPRFLEGQRDHSSFDVRNTRADERGEHRGVSPKRHARPPGRGEAMRRFPDIFGIWVALYYLIAAAIKYIFGARGRRPPTR